MRCTLKKKYNNLLRGVTNLLTPFYLYIEFILVAFLISILSVLLWLLHSCGEANIATSVTKPVHFTTFHAQNRYSTCRFDYCVRFQLHWLLE